MSFPSYSLLSALACCLFFSSCGLRGQPTEEDYARETNAFREAVTKDFAIFLNPRQSEATRLQAIADHRIAYDEKQKDALVALARNARSSDRLRAAALARIESYYLIDNNAINTVSDWLVSGNTPPNLRKAAREKFEEVSVSALGRRELNDLVTSTYRKLALDQEVEYRRSAFNYLMGNNDDEARRLLLRGLQPQLRERPLPITESLELLALFPSEEDYPVVRPYLQPSNPLEVRLGAVRVLGNDRQQKDALIKIVSEGQQELVLRQTALATLNGNYPQEFSDIGLPLLQADGVPATLRIYIIQTERFRRNDNRLRSRKEQRDGRYRRDAFDEAVYSLRESRDSSLARAALLYIKSLQLD